MPHAGEYQPLLPPVKWQAPTYLNSWADFGAPYAAGSFYKDSSGIVRLRGLIKSGVIGSPAFVLPVGFRIEFDALFPALANAAFGVLTISANGNVTPTSGSNAFFSLEGISFRAL